MKVLVWQWGRRGAGPRFAVCLANSMRGLPEIEVSLSLCQDAEIMRSEAPRCEMPVRTYRGLASYLLRLMTSPAALPLLFIRLRRIRPELAICAMPGPFDFVMGYALRLLRVKLVVIVHEAKSRSGDGFTMQWVFQRLLCRCADALVVLSKQVGSQLASQRFVSQSLPMIRSEHPPLMFNLPAGERAAGPHRLLFFGRLAPYKGLGLLARAIALLPPTCEIAVRVVGSGPDSAELDALRRLPNVSVENRWVPETEIGTLLGWADAVILPYREASQSGVAAAAVAAGRLVIATRVGGLVDQLATAHGCILCEPVPLALSNAISLWLSSAPETLPMPDGGEDWRRAASLLLRAIESHLPLQLNPAIAVDNKCPKNDLWQVRTDQSDVEPILQRANSYIDAAVEGHAARLPLPHLVD